ncbi:MAG: ABC transporter ATP-binding protein [Anaerolineae bacterium]|jgi:ABC-type multidrug transport system fused ATPase/permease subunit|nr:ABC transporter ATP-binding protein [Anaerolineae bacterium]
MYKKFENKTFPRTVGLLGSKLIPYLLAAMTTSVVIGYGFNMVLAYISRNVLDASMENNQSLLVRALVLAGVTFFLGTPLWIGAQYLIARITKRSMNDFRVTVFGHIVKLPANSFGQQHSGDLVSRTTNDLGGIEGIFKWLIPNLMLGFFLGIVGVVLIFIMDWRFGLIALGTGLCVLLLGYQMSDPMRKASETVQKTLGKQTERLTDLLQGLQVAKMFHLEESNLEHYRQANAEWAAASLKHGHLQAVFFSLNGALDAIKSIGTLVFGLYLLTLGYGTLGTVAAAISLQGTAGFLFSNIGNFITGIQQSLAGCQRVYEVLDQPTEEMLAKDRQKDMGPAASSAAAVAVSQLCFSYKPAENEEKVLEKIDMTIAPGQLCALVGPSGGGKSTLIKLLMGLYMPTDGEVLLQGKSTSQFPLEDLREMIAYVPQDAYLFDGTIEENIRFGNPAANEEAFIAAAKAAYAHDFILEQPDGYQTLVGEHGAHLSGGQRQRIAIARALLKNAPILLLDEATSALDSESERLVQKALDSLMEGRTTIAVAHRLSTIQNADTIYVIDDGHVIEQGRHEQLLQQNGLYRELHDIQFSRG